MHGGVENPLRTPRYTPSQSSSGGVGWRGRGEHMHTCLAYKYNSPLSLELQVQSSSIGFSFSYSYLLSVNLLQYSSLASPDLAPAKSVSSTVARWSQRPSQKIFTFLPVYLFFQVLAAITALIKCGSSLIIG